MTCRWVRQGAALALHRGLAAVAAATAAETVGAAAAAAKEAAAADTRDRLRLLELELETAARSPNTRGLASGLGTFALFEELSGGWRVRSGNRAGVHISSLVLTLLHRYSLPPPPS